MVLIVVAGSIIGLLAFVALAVDIGYFMVARNELQNIADGSALAGCGKLGNIYQNMTSEEQKIYVCDPAPIIDTAKDVGNKNNAGGVEGISIRDEDVIIGTWDSSTSAFTQGLDQPDAVKVIARRDEIQNSPITTFFARVVGVDTIAAEAQATAALTDQSTTAPGELELPVGISKWYFTNHNCNDYIVFHPTNDPDACAGWNVFDYYPASASTLKDILKEELESSATAANATEFTFTGGDAATAFDELLLLFMRKGFDTTGPNSSEPAQEVLNADGDWVPKPGALEDGADGTVALYELNNQGVLERAYYPDDNKNPTPRNYHRWETTVVVYDSDDCSNPTGKITIVGYAKIALTDVQSSPDKRIVGKILCDLFSEDPTRGGGGPGYGVKGTIPGLVE